MNSTPSFTLIKRRLQRMVALQAEAPDGSYRSTLPFATSDSAPTMDNSGSALEQDTLAPGLETQSDAFAGLDAWWRQLRTAAVDAPINDAPVAAAASSTDQTGGSSPTADQAPERAVDLLVASIWQELQASATDGRLQSIWAEMYGETLAGSQAAQNLLTSLQLGQGLPLVVRLLNNETIQSAFAAYTHSGADGRETIYLNQDWLQFASLDEVAAKLTEEIGHALDLRLTNGGDGSGDEGEEFSLRFAETTLSSQELNNLHQQDDHGTLTIDGQLINVEFATVSNTGVTYTEDSATYANIFSQNTSTSTFTGSTTVINFKVTVSNSAPQDFLYFHPTAAELTEFLQGQIEFPLGVDNSTPQSLSSNPNITYTTSFPAFNNPNNLTSIVFTFNSSVTATARQSFKNQFSKTLAFATTSQDPTVPSNQRVVTLFDNGTTATRSNTITVIGIDDAPKLSVEDKGPRSFQEGQGSAVQGSEVVVFASVTADPVESAQAIVSFKIAISGLKDGNQEQIAFNGGSFIGLGGDTSGATSISGVAFSWSYLASTGLLSFAKSGATGLNKSQAKAFFESFRYKNIRIDDPTAGDRQFVISEIVDSGSSTGSNRNTTTDSLSPTSLTQTTISVVATNDRPVLTAFTPVFPDTKSTISSASNPGILVSDLLANAAISDPDVATAARAIYITSVDNSSGSWQYLADPSIATSWTTISFAGPNAGLRLLLGSSDKIRFQPNASSLGTYGLTFGAWDQSNVAAAPARTYQAADTSVTSPYSSLTVSGSVTVVSNGLPVYKATGSTIAGALTETVGTPASGAQLVSTGLIGFTDSDAGDTHTATIISSPSGQLGALSLGQLDQTNRQVAWTYTLPANAVESLAAGQTLTQDYVVAIADNDGASFAQSITLTITGTNDAPVVTNAAGALSGSVTEAGSSGNGTPSVTGTLSASDVDAGATQTWSIQGTPSTTYGSVAINATTGVWSYTLDNTAAATQALKQGGSVTQSYTARVTDEFGASADQTITVLITGANDTPVVTNAAGARSGSVTEAGSSSNGSASVSGTLSASDVDAGATQTWSIQGTPSTTYGSVAINATTGVWSYTLDNTKAATQALKQGESVTESYTARVSDEFGASADQTISVLITGANDAPVVFNSTATTGEKGVLSSSVPAATDVDGTIASYSLVSGIGSGNGSLTFNSNGSYSFDPGSAFQGLGDGESRTVSFTYLATDNNGANSASQTVSITVTGTNDVATLSSDSRSLSETNAVLTTSGTLTVTDLDAIPATVVPQTNASGSYGTFSITSAGAWTYATALALNSLNAGQVVNDVFTVSTTDGGTASVTVTITGTNDVATLSSDSRSLTETNAVLTTSGTLSVTDLDATAATVVAQPNTTGSYGTFSINSAGAWTYSTASALNALNPGQVVSDVFSVATTDGGTASVTVSITGTNDVATLSSDSRSLTETNSVLTTSGTLSVIDLDATAATVVAQTNASGSYGTFSINSAGEWTYSTASALNSLSAAQVVSDVFSVATTDGGTAAVTVSITGSNDAPVAFGDLQATSIVAILNSSVPNATDVDGTVSSYTLINGVGSGNGSLTFNADGSYSFNPGSDFDGLGRGASRTVSFTYLATDNNGANSASQTVTIEVTGVNDTPIAYSGSGTTGENAILSSSVPAATDPDGTVSSYSLVDSTGSGNGSLTFNPNGSYVFDPGSDFDALGDGDSRTVSFTYIATDNNGADSASQAVTITVTGSNDVATLSSDSKSLTETNAVLTTSGTLSVTDLDATAATVVAQPNTTGSYGTFSITSAGEWTYSTASALNSLNAGQVVSDVFSVATTDGGTAAVTVSITGTNDVATLSSDSRSLSETNAALSTSGSLSLTDLDATAATVVAQPNTTGSYGTFSINSAGEWTYSTASALNSLNAGQVVNDVFSVATTDGGSAAVTVTITGTDDAATLSSDSQSLTETNAVLTTSGTLSVTDLDATAATVVAQTNASGSYGTFSIDSAGAWTYSTASALNSLNAGQVVSDVFSVATTDGGTAAVTVTITGTDDVATLSSDSRSLSETNAALSTSGSLSLTDLDATAATVVAQPNTTGSYGTFSINSAGEWTYSTASALNSLNAGQVVSDVFSVATTDGGTASVTVSITGSNDVASLSSDSQSLTETNAVLTTSGTLTVTDLDATAATVVAQPNTTGSYGTFSINSAGEWTYSTASALNSLNAGQVVSDVFSVATTDGGTASVTVTITGTNDVATLSSDSRSLTETNAVLTTSGTLTVTDLDATAATVVAQTNASGSYGTFSINSAGDWTYATASALNSLNAGQVVNDVFSVATTDGGTASVTVSITGSNDVATLSSDSRSLTETNAVLSTSGTLSVTDLDATAATVVAQPNTTGSYGTFSINSAGEWTYSTASALNSLNAGQVVSDVFSVATTDGGTAAVTVSITGTNDVATLSSDSRSLTETNAVLSTSGTLSVTDLDATAATVAAQTNASGSYGTFSINSAGAWTYSTASALNSLNAGQVVSDVFSVATTDGSTASVTVTITGSNDVATLSSDSRSLTETNAALTTSGTLSVTDLDATAATVVAQPNTTGSYGTFSIDSAGAWTYSTASALNSLNAGQVVSDVFSVATTDGGTASVTVSITGSNDVATLSSDSRSLTETNAALSTSGTLSVTDLDATAATVVAQTNAAGSYGTFSITSAGAWTYSTASALNSLNAGQVVNDVFSVATTDGGTASVTVSITGSNDVATLSSDSRSLTETNAVLSTSGTLSVTDLDATAATVAAQTNATGSYGTFSINSAGAWTYSTASALNSLNAGQVVSDVFSVATTDGGSAAVTVSITGSNDAPVATYNSVFQVVEDDPIITGQITSTDPDAGSIRTYALVGAAIDGFSLNSNGNWSFNPAAATYQPLAAGSTQAVLVNYRVTDDAGATDTGTFQITVTGAFDPPSIAPITSGSISEVSQSSTITSSNLTGTAVAVGFEAANTINFSISGGTATVSGDPAGFTTKLASTYGTLYLNGSTGAYQYIANTAAVDGLDTGETASQSFTISAANNLGASASTTYAINITGADDAPVLAVIASGAISEITGSSATTTSGVSGVLQGTDVDIEPLTYGILGSASGSYGTLSVNSSTGSYLYTPIAANVEKLAAGVVVSDTFTFTVSDGDDSVVSRPYSVSITGANDAPTITQPIADFSFIEALDAVSQSLSSAGTISFSDVDNGAILGVSYALTAGATWNLSGGGTGSLSSALKTSLENGFAISGSNLSSPNSANWTYSASGLNLDFLAVGDTITWTYSVNVTDSLGATASDLVTITIQGTNEPLVIESSGTTTIAASGPHPLEFKNVTSADVSIMVSAAVAVVSDTFATRTGAKLNASTSGWGVDNQNFDYFNNAPTGSIGSEDSAEVIEVAFTDYDASINYTALSDKAYNDFRAGTYQRPVPFMPGSGSASQGQLVYKPVDGFGFDVSKLTAGSAADFLIGATYLFSNGTTQTLRYQFSNVSVPATPIPRIYVGLDPVTGASTALSWLDADNDSKPDLNETPNGTVTALNTFTNPGSATLLGIISADTINNEFLVNNTLTVESFNVTNPRFYDLL